MNKLTELIEVARAAAVLDHNEAEEWYSAELMEVYAFFPKNARFIAACDPATILELCALLQQAEKALETYSNRFENNIAYKAITAIRQWKEPDMKPVARLHIRLEDDGLEARVEVLDGANLQVENSPAGVFTADQLRAAKIEVLREAAAKALCSDDKHMLLRMADELE